MSQNNQCTWCSPLKYGMIFSKQNLSWGDKSFFGQRNCGEVVLNWRTNDQIMPKFWMSFINDQFIFQSIGLVGPRPPYKIMNVFLLNLKSRVMFNFLYIDSHLGYWYIIWKVNIRNTEMNLRNTLLTLMFLCGVGISWKASGLGASE